MLRAEREKLRNSALKRMREAWLVKTKTEKQPKVIEETHFDPQPLKNIITNENRRKGRLDG